MFRSALVALKPGPHHEAFLQQVTTLAARQRWHLAGVAVIDHERVAPAEPVPMGASAFKAHRDEVVLEKTRVAVAAALAEFSRHCEQRAVPYTTIPVEDGIVEALTHGVEEHDLLIVGRHTEPGVDELAFASPLRDVLKQIPRPALMLPNVASERKQVVVAAYDGSAQAARTLQAFVLSGLAVDCEVRVVTFGDHADKAIFTASRAVNFLRHHGIAATLDTAAATVGLGVELLEACRKHQAACLVMGAYGQSPLRELFFGSVTRTVLASADFPVFMTH